MGRKSGGKSGARVQLHFLHMCYATYTSQNSEITFFFIDVRLNFCISVNNQCRIFCGVPTFGRTDLQACSITRERENSPRKAACSLPQTEMSFSISFPPKLVFQRPGISEMTKVSPSHFWQISLHNFLALLNCQEESKWPEKFRQPKHPNSFAELLFFFPLSRYKIHYVLSKTLFVQQNQKPRKKRRYFQRFFDGSNASKSEKTPGKSETLKLQFPIPKRTFPRPGIVVVSLRCTKGLVDNDLQVLHFTITGTTQAKKGPECRAPTLSTESTGATQAQKGPCL